MAGALTRLHAAMGVQVPLHPAWVADLDRAIEPIQQTILNTPVVEDAAENCLAPAKIQNFLVAFYPIIRDFPQWLHLLLDRSPDDGRAFFEDNIQVRSEEHTSELQSPCNLVCRLLLEKKKKKKHNKLIV